MARSTLLFCCLLIFANTGFAQQKLIDSLHQQLQNKSIKDTLRLDILKELAFEYGDSDPEKGLLIADQAIYLAKKINNKKKLATAYFTKGYNYEAKGEDSLALGQYQQAYRFHSQIRNKKGMGNVLHNMGIIYFGWSDFPKAIEAHRKSLALFEGLKDSSSIIYSLNSIGVNYMTLPDYPKAITYYLKALKLGETIYKGPNTITAATYQNIGLIYKNMADFDKAISWQEKALRIHQKLDNKQYIASAMSNLATIYDLQGQPHKALEYYKNALEINQQINYKKGIASDHSNIGIVYNGVGDYENALKHLARSVKLFQELNNKVNLSIALNELGFVFLRAPNSFLIKRGISPSGRYSRVLEYQKRGLQLGEETGSLTRQRYAWEALSDTYTKQKDFAKALHAHKQYKLFQDSIFTTEKDQEITSKMMTYDFEKKEAVAKANHDKQTALVQAEAQKQRYIKNNVIGGSALILLLTGTGYAFYKRRRDAENRQKEAELKALVAETEMKALRVQMNPHFIFNSLNSISSYLANHDTTGADYYLTKFAKIMRMILENSEKKEISLADELKALELYMQLEALRMDHKFSYDIVIDEDIDVENTLVPPLILQPFVENSIWHGLSRKEGTGKILVHIKKEGNMILCLIDDNGIGRQRAEVHGLNGRKSLGMKITRARIDVINKLKKSNAGVNLSDLAQGTRVEVKLPLELSF